MTLQQLEYALAIGRTGSFVQAAEECFVTQPTLSMQVKKLEEEVGITIFDRSRQPVTVTDAGKIFLDQARIVVREKNRLMEVLSSAKGEVAGSFRLGIIPTLAPYLVPLFLPKFAERYPAVHLEVEEMTTAMITEQLKKENLDAGILATPLEEYQLHEHFLFNEPYVAYLSKKHSLWNKKQLKPDDIDAEDLWLLSDGHCMKNQVLQLCNRRKAQTNGTSFEFRSGSIETLRRMVETGKGMTILPWLAVPALSQKQQEAIRYFRTPEPVREISIVTHRAQLKKAIIDALAEVITDTIPKHLKRSVKQDVLPVEA
jgi:LysR family transcriptional regulator, hydrogen peroxide-inducible genes activator